MATLAPAADFDGAKTRAVSLGLGLLGFAVLAVGWARAPQAAAFAYLTAFCCITAIALGGLIFLMIGHVVNATWSVVLRRLNESIASTFPLLAVLFVPIAVNLRTLYSWVNPERAYSGHELELLRHKAPYLNPGAFELRTAGYFALWIVTFELLRSPPQPGEQAREQPATSDTYGARRRKLSGALLPLVSLALTFASFDWLMSLEPLWSTTMFGVYYFAGGFVASLGLLALLSHLARHRQATSQPLIRPPHFHALGRLMFAFSIFWAYCAFFQVMLIQIADKPDEVAFYTVRLTPGFGTVALLLFVLRFLVPFAVLLPRAIKFRPRAMALVGALLLLGQYLDVLWLVAPAKLQHRASDVIWDIAALLAVGGSSVAFAAWRSRGPWAPLGDPKLLPSSLYRSPI